MLVLMAACGDKRAAKDPPVATGPTAGDGGAATAPSDAATAPPAAIIDRTAETTALLTRWSAPDGVEQVYAAAHSLFRARVSLEELRIFHDDFVAKAGAFVAVKSSQGVQHTTKDGRDEDVVRGRITFANGAGPYGLVLSLGQNRLAMVHWKLELPPALQTPPDRDAARALARTVAQDIVAVDLAKVDANSLPLIRGQVAPADATRMRAAVAALGAKPTLAVQKDAPCGDAVHCVTFRVSGPAGAATIVLTLSAPLGRWRVANWNFEPETAKEASPTP